MKSPADRRARATNIALCTGAALALSAGWATSSWWMMMWLYYLAVVSMFVGQCIQRIGRS